MPLNPIATAIRRAPSRDIAASYSVAWSLLHDLPQAPLLMDNVHASRIRIDMGQPEKMSAVGTSGTILSTLWRIVTRLAAKVRAPGGPGLILALCVASCASIGPGTVPRDRLDYISAIGESWKEQTLLNIVRLRYGDAPTFVDVSSVISGYTFQGQVSAGGQFSSSLTNTIPSSLGSIGGNAQYIDRPTITYTPLAGDRFARSLLRPLPPSEVFELIQAGYPADNVLLMTIRAVNGVYNRSGIGARAREADPEFYPLLDALRRLQLSGAISVRLVKRGQEEIGMLILSSKRTADVSQDLQFVRKTLGVTPDQNGEIGITFGLLPRSSNEIALLTRSMAEILIEVSAGIEVPSEHVAEGRTVAATRVVSAENPRDRPMIRIRSSASPPAATYAAVRYRDTWYWIDDGDYASKRVFTFLMIFFSLAETGVTPQAPVLTVPAN
jgi:hypothetical protein